MTYSCLVGILNLMSKYISGFRNRLGAMWMMQMLDSWKSFRTQQWLSLPSCLQSIF